MICRITFAANHFFMSGINLISDTATLPTKGMLEAMFNAKVGDDVFSQDPTINRLQDFSAEMFGMEAGLFCPSGTMTNQIALAVHTGRLQEVICHEYSHIYQYETGGFAYNSGIGVKLLQGAKGKITVDQVAAAINPDYDWLAESSLVSLENTTNKGGGAYYTLEEIRPIGKLCKEKGLGFHLDGARIFNALVETGESPQDVGKEFDSISVCLSKGLGAPVGSVLLGSKDFIKKARRLRKAMGGGMRQAGYLAAACIYALENHIDRLKEDHARAKNLGKALQELDFVEGVHDVDTNIVIFDVKEPYDAARFLDTANKMGLIASPFGPRTIRFCTYLGINDEMIEDSINILKEINQNFLSLT